MILLEPVSDKSKTINPALIEPWSAPPKQCLKQIQSVLRYDAFLVAVGDPNGVQADEILATQGFAPAAVAKSLGGDTSLNKISAAFSHHGTMTTVRGQKGSPTWLADYHSVVVAVLEPHPAPRVWWLVLARTASIFTNADRELALILLRRWQCEFVSPSEARLGRVLLGHDDRLILSDLSMRERFLREPGTLEALIVNLKLVVEQRVPELADNQVHDFVASIGKVDLWVTFRRRSVVAGSSQWYLELRPTAEDELPAIGLIDDERVAAAVAFIHDRYAETPSLVELAEHVHMSPFHFHRLFSKVIAVTPKQYMLRRQMQISKWLLRAKRVPIGSIASRTGFASHGHFTSTFHRLIGMSPTEYRDSASEN